MFNTTTMSVKRQVTIPKVIADALMIKAGDRLIVTTRRDTGEIIMRPRTGNITDLFGILSHVKIPPGKTIENLIEEGRTAYLTEKYQRLGFLSKTKNRQ